MKKTLLISVFIVMVLIFYHFFIWGKLGDGYYLQQTSSRLILSHKENKNFFFSNIVTIKNNKNHIIAIVDKERFFSCNQTSPVMADGVRYILVNKQTNKIYETDNLKRFRQKLESMDISLDFSENEIQRAYHTYERNKHLYKNQKSLEFLKQHCKEDFVYPIEKF